MSNRPTKPTRRTADALRQARTAIFRFAVRLAPMQPCIWPAVTLAALLIGGWS